MVGCNGKRWSEVKRDYIRGLRVYGLSNLANCCGNVMNINYFPKGQDSRESRVRLFLKKKKKSCPLQNSACAAADHNPIGHHCEALQ